MFRAIRATLVSLVLASLAPMIVFADDEYDPLSIGQTETPFYIDASAIDELRDRTLPFRVYLPETDSAAPVILFSHGLGGSREGSKYLGEHWSMRGYAVVYLQHPGSDDTVWKGVPMRQRFAAMQDAASPENAIARFIDAAFLLDTLETLNADRESAFFGRFDLARIGMAGHSFGARTTQVLSGQALPQADTRFADARIDAALPMSPSSHDRHLSLQAQFSGVRIPWLLMTGTEDLSPIGGQTLASRLAVFEALPEGDKFQLVLGGGAHHAFTDGPTRPRQSPRNPDHHPLILALSTAFWDAYLLEHPKAKDWLLGPGAANLLSEDDDWQLK